MGNWNHLKIIHKIPGQNTGRVRSQGTTENSHIGYCPHNTESTNVKYKTINKGNNITCTINSNHGTAAEQCTIQTGYFQEYNCKYPV
jgi:hypothetical protein